MNDAKYDGSSQRWGKIDGRSQAATRDKVGKFFAVMSGVIASATVA